MNVGASSGPAGDSLLEEQDCIDDVMRWAAHRHLGVDRVELHE